MAFRRFNHLDIPEHWERYWTKYPQGLTILEGLLDWVSQVDSMVDNVNEWNTYLQQFVKDFDKNLTETTRKVLIEWVNDGTLAHLVNSVIFDTHVYNYNTVQDMKNDTGLIVGDRVHTWSYHNLFEGGGADYIIVEDTSIVDHGNPSLANGLTAKLVHNGTVGITQYGAKNDTSYDNIEHFRQALDKVGHITGQTGWFSVSDEIVLSPYQSIIGDVENTREQGDAFKILYTGALNRNKAVIRVGLNPVNSEPVNPTSNIILKNVYVDANNLAGHGVYGTYITNQSLIEKITVRNSREFNFYFARSWYASFRDLTSLSCRNNGLAFGMPLEYLDGEQIVWQTQAPLEMNNTDIDNIQSQRAGTYFADEKAAVWAPDGIHKRHGYGVGLGIGNSFRATGITSEQSGGVNLYDYTGAQPGKYISNLYLEKAMHNSGKTGKDVTGIIIESIIGTGAPEIIEKGFINYANGGGIYVTGVLGTRKIWLKDIHQPRFLLPLNLEGISTSRELYTVVLKDNVYTDCGTYNMDMTLNYFDSLYSLNTRYSFNTKNLVEFNYTGSSKVIYIRNVPQADGSFIQPYGALAVVNNDGTKTNLSIPSSLTREWTYAGTATSKGIGLEKTGGTGEVDAFIEIKTFSMKPTYY